MEQLDSLKKTHTQLWVGDCYVHCLQGVLRFEKKNYPKHCVEKNKHTILTIENLNSCQSHMCQLKKKEQENVKWFWSKQNTLADALLSFALFHLLAIFWVVTFPTTILACSRYAKTLFWVPSEKHEINSTWLSMLIGQGICGHKVLMVFPPGLHLSFQQYIFNLSRLGF